VFVLPSLAEGFGMPALEAMTCGVPVIAANRSALPEVVGSAGRLIDPENPEELADVLYHVLTDDGLRTRMRDAGIEQARRFRWKDAAAGAREAWALAAEERRRRRG
jgi:glycosyltransferase involved in cell wall biosynthesis